MVGGGINGTNQLEPSTGEERGGAKTQEEGRESQWGHWKAFLPSRRGGKVDGATEKLSYYLKGRKSVGPWESYLKILKIKLSCLPKRSGLAVKGCCYPKKC